jgi:transcriptional regulator
MVEDVEQVKDLIQRHPLVTVVSDTANGLVASHYPVLLEPGTGDDIVLLTHFGCPDDQTHELGRHEVLVVVQGPHGYVSPGWYPPGQIVPTWNYANAHLWGQVEIMSEPDKLSMFHALVDRFERVMPCPRSLSQDEEMTRQVASEAVGVRIRVTRFEARFRLSQNKPPELRDHVIEQLDQSGPYANPGLADFMRHRPA